MYEMKKKDEEKRKEEELCQGLPLSLEESLSVSTGQPNILTADASEFRLHNTAPAHRPTVAEMRLTTSAHRAMNHVSKKVPMTPHLSCLLTRIC